MATYSQVSSNRPPTYNLDDFAFPTVVPRTLGLPILSPDVRTWRELSDYVRANLRTLPSDMLERTLNLQAEYAKAGPAFRPVPPTRPPAAGIKATRGKVTMRGKTVHRGVSATPTRTSTQVPGAAQSQGLAQITIGSAQGHTYASVASRLLAYRADQKVHERFQSPNPADRRQEPPKPMRAEKSKSAGKPLMGKLIDVSEGPDDSTTPKPAISPMLAGVRMLLGITKSNDKPAGAAGLATYPALTPTTKRRFFSTAPTPANGAFNNHSSTHYPSTRSPSPHSLSSRSPSPQPVKPHRATPVKPQSGRFFLVFKDGVPDYVWVQGAQRGDMPV